MASATAPPTPVSISSNTKVGAEPRSASTTLSASRKRASSPPEATFISGPGRVPGLVCTQNSTRSMPFGPAARLGERAGGGTIIGLRLARGIFKRLELTFAGIDQRHVGLIFLRQRREIIDRHAVFARGGAQAEQPFLDA